MVALGVSVRDMERVKLIFSDIGFGFWLARGLGSLWVPSAVGCSVGLLAVREHGGEAPWRECMVGD